MYADHPGEKVVEGTGSHDIKLFHDLRFFGTFQKDSGSLELFKGSQVHNQEQKVTEQWLLPKFVLRTSYLSSVFTLNLQFSNSPKVHHQINSFSFSYRMYPVRFEIRQRERGKWTKIVKVGERLGAGV